MPIKKVLFIINSGLLNSGVSRVAVDIIEGLADDFLFDIVVQSDKVDFYNKYLLNRGCSIYYLGYPPHGRKRIFYNLTKRNVQLYRIIKKGNYDVVHSFTAYQSGLDCAVAAFAGVRIRISNTHGTVVRNRSVLTGTYQKICSYLIRACCTSKIGVSRQAASSIYGSSQYRIIYNSIDFIKYQKIIKKKHSGINMLQIGYFNSNKNQLFSLQVLEYIIAQGVNAHLYFIGYENEVGYFDRLNKYIMDKKLLNFVSFLPHDYDKFNIFPLVDFMIHPSCQEGFSLVALECQAADITCLVSDAVPEIVNIGLLIRLPLTDISEWVRIILENNVLKKINEEKASLFSRDLFISSFKSIYEGREK